MDNHFYGYIPDCKDHRDLKFCFSTEQCLTPLPKSVDLSDGMPSVFDQMTISSCTANAIVSAMEFCEKKKNPQYNTILSRLFLYYNEREIEGNIDFDSGASLRDGIKCINNLGVCIEEDWSYDISKYKIKPSTSSYDNALHQEAVNYQSLHNDLDSLKRCLASGFPFVCGISLFSSFESTEVARTGIVPMPTNSDSFLGGHAITIFSFSDDTQKFKCRNSWGPNWGDKGNFYLDYNYLLQLGADMWVIQTVN